MTAHQCKKSMIGLSVLLAGTCFAVCNCWVMWTQLQIRVVFAEDQVAIFDEMRTRTESSDVPTTIGYLEYVVSYYPSGTKQSKDSRLDRIVERARQNAIREMIEHLRTTTGKDLGEEPQQWIETLPNPRKAN